MNSTFLRAFLGFLVLTIAVTGMAYVALWALQSFAGGSAWASLLVVAIALIAEIMVYTSTLHDPVYNWIKEPERRREAEEQRALEAERKSSTS